MAQIRLALQLYTVRDHANEDFVGTLKRVKEIGYDVVEGGAGPLEAADMKKALDDIGLSMVSMHIPLNELEGNLDKWIEYARTIGATDIVCPWLPEDRRAGKDAWLATAAMLDEAGARCGVQDVRFSYHNHSFEFVKLDGQYALDLLYASTAPENLKAQLDTYWVQHGGEDPAQYIRKYAGRCPLVHIKDMAADENRSFAEIGRGILDWPAILEAARASEVEYFIVEQDRCAGDSLESAAISCEFARDLLAEGR